MSNEIMNAIDGGLRSLQVTEKDVAAILRRARTEEKPARRQHRLGPALALAVAMALLVIGAGVRLMQQKQPDIVPLNQVTVQYTAVPAISANDAIVIAERYIHTQESETADLRDGSVYEIGCEWIGQKRVGNLFYSAFYEVAFKPLNEYATEYVVWVRGSDGEVIGCERSRGVGEGHTAQEIYTGYARVFGEDRRLWSQEQLTTYAKMLRKAETSSLRWMDYLYMQSSYIEVRYGDRLKSAAVQAALAELEHMGLNGMNVGEPRARYLNAVPQPVWKVAIDLNDGNTMLAEIDSVNGSVLLSKVVDSHYAEQHESFLQSTIDALNQVTMPFAYPELAMEENKAIAAEYIRSTWGETRDVNDESLFSCEEAAVSWPIYQCERGLIYRSKGEGEITEYAVYVNSYGEVIAANTCTRPADSSLSSFLPTTIDIDWVYENLCKWQDVARQSVMQDDPIVQAFMNTVYVPGDYGLPHEVLTAAGAAVQARASSRSAGVLIEANPFPVWKLALETDQGHCLIELDSVTLEVKHVQRVADLYATWYLPFILSDDLQAAGMKLMDSQRRVGSTADVAHGTVSGMRADHLYERFKALYGPDLADWSQEQLRAFQQMLILSNDYDYDLAVPCLRNTIYPDLPQGALSREAASVKAAEALDMKPGWVLEGGVLIGTEGTPVWKLCYYLPDLAGVDGFSGHWYVEVDCMTGEPGALERDPEGVATPGACYDNGVPDNLWFREIVREKTIRECDRTWESIGNG